MGENAEIHERLGQALGEVERQGERLAVLCVQLDPEPGADPEVVREHVLLRLTPRLRATDAALFGGGADRLLVFLPGVESVGDAATVARKVMRLLAEPLAVEGREMRVEGRVGLALYPDHGFDPSALLRNAEAAMLRAESDVRWHASPAGAPDGLAS